MHRWLRPRPSLRVLVDDPDRRSESEALRRQLDALLDHAELGIAFMRDDRFERVSEHFCRLFDWERAQLHGRSARMLHGSDDAFAALGQRAGAAFAEHGSFEGELELVRRSGQPFWARVRARRVGPDGGAEAGSGDTILWIVEDMTRAREQRGQLAWAAAHDALTGLTNRAAFEALLDEATERAPEPPFCVLFIELERFEDAGDALPPAIAKLLSAQVRLSDTLARLGADTFAVLLNRCLTAQALLIAEKLRAAIGGHTLVCEERPLRATVSIGLVAVERGFGDGAAVL